MILRYILYWPVNFALVLLAYVLSPFLALWSMKYGPVLPGRWRLFSTLNATLDGYIAQGVDGFDPNAKGFKLWWQRTRWTWRNPCNGWQSELLGIKNIDQGFTVKKDIPLFGGYKIKFWCGWNNNKRGGNYYPYAFQCSIRRK